MTSSRTTFPKALDATANPRVRGVELFNPGEEQIRAMIQGIYETKLESEYGVRFYDDKGMRLDAKLGLTPDQIKPFMSSAFRIGKGNAKKLGYSERRHNQVLPTLRSIIESQERYHDYDRLIENRQSYEETLGLSRHDGFYRVTIEPAVEQLKYFVWPLLNGQIAPRAFDTREAAIRERDRRNV